MYFHVEKEEIIISTYSLTTRNEAQFIKKHEVFKVIKDQLKAEWGFPGGAVVKNPPASAGNTGSSPGPGGSHMPRSS